MRNATPSFKPLFGWAPDEGTLLAACLDGNALREMVEARAPHDYKELRFARPDGQERTVRVTAVYAPELTGERVLLCVCHELTDFKQRVELEVARSKDKEARAHPRSP